MIRVDVEQNTVEWDAYRLGRITASNYQAIMANSMQVKGFNPEAAFGETAHKYAMRKALERLTGETIETFKSEAMERGNALEYMARELYQETTFAEVLPGGVAYMEQFLASSDGLVKDSEGAIEIKSVLYNTHFKRLKAGGYDTSYKWQIVGNMWLYQLDWIDFVQYCPDFPTETQLYIHRVERDDDAIGELRARLFHFEELVHEYIDIAKNKN